jgi:hypothetical protein
MSEQANDSTVENGNDAGMGDIDAQLGQMQAAEKGEQAQAEKNDAPNEGAQAQAEEGQQQQQKTVPLQALHEARNETRQLRQQLAQRDRENQEQLARVNARLEALFRPQQQVPDKATDAVGYLDHRLGEVAEGQRQIMQREQQREQQAVQVQQFNALANRVVGSEQAFAAATPDYAEAVKHMDTIRIRELQVLGMTEDQAAHHAAQERVQAALTWAHQGMNPAQVAYELAKTRGYTPRAQSSEQRVEAQQRGTQAARSLGSGGAGGSGRLTAEALAKMSDEDFAKLTDSDFRKAMGG